MDTMVREIERRAATGDPQATERLTRVNARIGVMPDYRITKAVAMSLGWRHEVYNRSLRNRDGSPLRARVNGRCKVWKTRPTEFRLPMKHGLRQCFYITEDNASDWSLSEEDAAS